MLEVGLGRRRLILAGHFGRGPTKESPWWLLRIYVPRVDFGFYRDDFNELEVRLAVYAQTAGHFVASEHCMGLGFRILGLGFSLERRTGL